MFRILRCCLCATFAINVHGIFMKFHTVLSTLRWYVACNSYLRTMQTRDTVNIPITCPGYQYCYHRIVQYIGGYGLVRSSVSRVIISPCIIEKKRLHMVINVADIPPSVLVCVHPLHLSKFRFLASSESLSELLW